jgi:hypothetical protein
MIILKAEIIKNNWKSVIEEENLKILEEKIIETEENIWTMKMKLNQIMKAKKMKRKKKVKMNLMNMVRIKK